MIICFSMILVVQNMQGKGVSSALEKCWKKAFFSSKAPCIQPAERKVILSCAQRHVHISLNKANKQISPLQVLHCTVVESVELEGQGHHLTICITSQSSTLLPGLKSQKYHRDSSHLTSSLSLDAKSLWRADAIFVSGVLLGWGLC